MYYFDLSRKFYKEPKDLQSSYLNTASAYKKLGEYDKAILNYIKADSLLGLVKEYQIADKQFLYDLNYLQKH